MAKDRDEEMDGDDKDAKDEFVPVEKAASDAPNADAGNRDDDRGQDGDERREEARLGDDRRDDGDDRKRPRRQRDGETDDEYRERRRSERRTYRDRRNNEVRELRQQVQELAAALANNNRGTEASQMAVVDGRIEQARTKYNAAARQLAEATSGADGAAAVRATEAMQEAREEFNALTAYKNQAAERSRRPAPRQEQRLSPRAQRLMDRWMDKNDWFDPEGEDDDSQIVLTIDAALTKQGYQPDTQEYWDELDDRLRERNVRRRARDDRDDRDRDYEDDRRSRRDDRPRRRPPVGNGRDGNERGRRIEVTLSRERREALEAAGYDLRDPAKMQSILKRYRDFDEDHGLNGRGRR